MGWNSFDVTMVASLGEFVKRLAESGSVGRLSVARPLPPALQYLHELKALSSVR